MAQTSEPAPPRLRLKGLKSPLAGPYDFEVEAGRCAVISGPSGSGKSLFLRMIADLDPSTGEVRLDELDRDAVPAPAWRRQVAYVPAEAGWWAETVAAHFAPAHLENAKVLAGRLGVAAELFAQPVARLSTGERQRLALVRGLVLKPRALLLDEPTSALDAESVGRAEAALRGLLQDGLVLILVTHDDALAARLGDHRYRMADRRLHPL